MGGLITAKISYSNNKLSAEYLRDKIAIISQYDWSDETESFIEQKREDIGARNKRM